jgi:hypothetical protein
VVAVKAENNPPISKALALNILLMTGKEKFRKAIGSDQRKRCHCRGWVNWGFSDGVRLAI